MWDGPWPGTEPSVPVLDAQSHNLWTTREVPRVPLVIQKRRMQSMRTYVLLWWREAAPGLWVFHQHQMHSAHSFKWEGTWYCKSFRVSFQKAAKGRNSTASRSWPCQPSPLHSFQLENEAISSISTLSAGLHFFFLSWLKLYSSCKIPTEFFGDSYLYSAEHFSEKCWIKLQGGRRYEHTF